jgi:outer membrane lipopolysaccharide assembly protein LptE/RlpB
MRRSWFFCLLLLSIAGCGYHLPGRGDLPAEIRTVYVDYFSNATLEPFLEREVTTSVIDRLARSRLLDMAAQRQGADAVLSGAIVSYGTTPVSYDRNDIVQEFRAAMTLQATLRDAVDGRVLWRGNVTWSEDFPAAADKAMQYSQEAAARQVISDRIAGELLVRIAEGF